MHHALLDLHPDVFAALAEGRQVVALESTFVSHGMPWPLNLDTALAVEAEVEGKLSEQFANAARGAAAIMAMNNVYYRFVHLVANPEYGTMPAKLRMNLIGSHGIAKEDFELFSIAVSAMNGCGMCIESHERVLLQHGVKSETIQSAVRIAAVLKAVATVHATL